MASLYADELITEVRADTATIARILSHGIHTYDLPHATPVDFSHIFPGPFDEDRTIDVLSIATLHRTEALDSFTYSNATPDPRSVLSALMRYFPDVWCLTESMRRAGAAGNIRLNMKGSLSFSWTSVLDNVSRSGIWSNQTFVFEIIQVLTHYGLQHSNVASNLAATGDHVSASKILKKGAGILKYVLTNLLPKWQSKPKNIPLECEPYVLDGIARIMLCQSQSMAIAKVLSDPIKCLSFPPATLAKLFHGCKELMDNAAASLRRLPKIIFARVDTELLECVGLWIKVYTSLTYKFRAVTMWREEKWGYATALSRQSQQSADDIALLENNTSSSSKVHLLNEHIFSYKKSCKIWKDRYVLENGSIYFDLPEPDFDKMTFLHTSTILGSTKSDPFVFTELPIVSFVSQELLEMVNNNSGEKKTKGNDGSAKDVTLSGMKGSHDLENGMKLMVAMGYKEEDCARVLPLVQNDVNQAVCLLIEESGGTDAGGTDGEKGKKQLEIELPEGLEGGMEIAVEDPETGVQHTVIVPMNYLPGTKILVDVAAA